MDSCIFMTPAFVFRQRKAALSMKQPCLGRRTWCRNSSVRVRANCQMSIFWPVAIGTSLLTTVACHSSGIDGNMVDQKGLTALGVVKEMPSQKSREIAALILGAYWLWKPLLESILLITHLVKVTQFVCLPQVTWLENLLTSTCPLLLSLRPRRVPGRAKRVSVYHMLEKSAKSRKHSRRHLLKLNCQSCPLIWLCLPLVLNWSSCIPISLHSIRVVIVVKSEKETGPMRCQWRF